MRKSLLAVTCIAVIAAAGPASAQIFQFPSVAAGSAAGSNANSGTTVGSGGNGSTRGSTTSGNGSAGGSNATTGARTNNPNLFVNSTNNYGGSLGGTTTRCTSINGAGCGATATQSGFGGGISWSGNPQPPRQQPAIDNTPR